MDSTIILNAHIDHWATLWLLVLHPDEPQANWETLGCFWGDEAIAALPFAPTLTCAL